ncbi:MAG: ABC transporter permease [Bacteroidota bacterium]
MFTQNSAYLAKRSWGYHQQEALYAEVPDLAAFEKLNASILQDPNILSISGSSHHLGKSNTTTVLHMPDRQYEVDQLFVDANYFETMGIQLQEGRAFKDHHENDKRTVIVNEVFVRELMKDPGNAKAMAGTALGQLFKIDSIQYEIIGVAKDFHSYNFYRKVNPTIFTVANREDYRYLSMRVKAGSEKRVHETLKTKWSALFPEIPFQGGYQEDVWPDITKRSVCMRWSGRWWQSLPCCWQAWDCMD